MNPTKTVLLKILCYHIFKNVFHRIAILDQIKQDLSISSNKPIGFGILTCENKTQALQRADANSGNKGREAAKACLDLLKLNYGQ